MDTNYRIILHSINNKRKAFTVKYIHDNFFSSQQPSVVINLISSLPQVITEVNSLSEAERIKGEIEDLGSVVTICHPDTILNLEKFKDFNQVSKDLDDESNVDSSTNPNYPIDYETISYYDLFDCSPHLLTQNAYDFVHRYAKAHNIDLPVKKDFNEKLAQCNTKKEVQKNKMNGIIIGIILVTISFFVLFVPDEEDTNYLVGCSLFFSGSIITLTQLTSKAKYYDSKKVEEARLIKRQNKNNEIEFYKFCLTQARQDYQNHMNFLSSEESSENIGSYVEYLLQNKENGIVQLELFALACKEYSSKVASDYDYSISLGVGVEFDLGAFF